jgi:hypothetical protein
MSTAAQRHRIRRQKAGKTDSVKALKMLGAKYFAAKARIKHLEKLLIDCECIARRKKEFLDECSRIYEQTRSKLNA